MVEQRFPQAAQRWDYWQLPVFAPSTALWSRIEAAHRGRQRTWRRRAASLSAVAAVLLAVVVGLARMSPTEDSQIGPGQRESQALEHEWQQLVENTAPAPAATLPLRVIDVALQSAYDHRAGAVELAALWQQRNRALRGLIARLHDVPAHDPRALMRI